MSLTPGLRKELGFLSISAIGSGLVGWLLGRLPEVLLISVILYLVWHLQQIIRLNLWLKEPKQHKKPYAVGIWSAVLAAIESLRERGRKRKRKLGRMLSGFQESTNALPDATVVIDSSGEMEWWNVPASEMLGLNRKRDKGRKIDQVITDRVFLKYLAEGDYLRPIQIPAPVDSGISLEVRVVPYGKGKRLLQARDITRLHQLETVRRDFVANVSHEMRTPLTVIHGYLETMGDSDDPSLADWQHIFGQMRQQTVRMQRIVGDLLLLSRLETSQGEGGQTVVDVPDLVKSLQQEAINLSGDAKHRITVDIDEELWLFANPDELDSAFSNLVFNAVRYTPAGGGITLQWVLTESGPCFTVKDTGIGIDNEHIPRLTERFYRVDVGRSRQSGGTGLGLAIVKHVLTRHNGALRIESEPGEGSIFTCSFPGSRVREAESGTVSAVTKT
ncbi:MAG: phosphate regulon sensor histidine kinase PhoR [Chromatiales bacterium]|nr:phosphate regulon sensor histidine kinase PhoR [Chromatiales bacterium]